MSNKFFDSAKEEALKLMETIIPDDTLDQKQQELVLRSIKEVMNEEDLTIDVEVLRRMFIEANFISDDDKNLTRTKKEFDNVIAFFIASEVLSAVSLGSNKMTVNEYAFNRAYRSLESSSYSIGSRK